MNILDQNHLHPAESALQPGTQRNLVEFVHIGTTALGSPMIKTPDMASENDYLAEIEKRRAFVLETENNTEGLNIPRVLAFRDQIGAPAKEIRFLSPEQYDKAIEIAGYDQGETHDSHGRYLEHLDVIVVRRDPELEALNGAEWTEANTVHEIAHSSAEMHTVQVRTNTTGRLFKKTHVNTVRARSGFLVHDVREPDVTRGSCLEEAYPDYERGQYVLSLGRKGGFVTADGTDFDRSKTIPLPGHYWWLDKKPDGTIYPTFAMGSPASATLELLIEQDPGILTALRGSRHSSDSYRELKQRMDAVAPGVFADLRQIDLRKQDELPKMAIAYSDVYHKFGQSVK